MMCHAEKYTGLWSRKVNAISGLCLDEPPGLEDNESRESARQSLFRTLRKGGKSGLRRAECQVTPGGREPTESAAENIPPANAGKGEMVR